MKYVVKPESPLTYGTTGRKDVVMFWHVGDTVQQEFQLEVFAKGESGMQQIAIPDNSKISFSLLREYNKECIKSWEFTNIPEDGIFTLTITPQESKLFSTGMYRIECKLIGTYYIPTKKDFEGIIPSAEQSIQVDNTYYDCSEAYITWKPNVFTISGMVPQFLPNLYDGRNFIFGNVITVPLNLFVDDSCISSNSTCGVTINNEYRELIVNENHTIVFLSTDNNTTQFNIWITKPTSEIVGMSSTQPTYVLQLDSDIIVRTEDCRLGPNNPQLLVGMDFYKPIQQMANSIKLLGSTQAQTVGICLNTLDNSLRGKYVSISVDTQNSQQLCPQNLCFVPVNLDYVDKLVPSVVTVYLSDDKSITYSVDTTKLNSTHNVDSGLTEPPLPCNYWKNCNYNMGFTICPLCKIRELSLETNFIKTAWGTEGLEKLAMVGD